MTIAYETKFAEFLRMCDEAKKGNIDIVLIHHPEVLGDNYTEMMRASTGLPMRDSRYRSSRVSSVGSSAGVVARNREPNRNCVLASPIEYAIGIPIAT